MTRLNKDVPSQFQPTGYTLAELVTPQHFKTKSTCKAPGNEIKGIPPTIPPKITQYELLSLQLAVKCHVHEHKETTPLAAVC
jgi:hypothetical protein